MRRHATNAVVVVLTSCKVRLFEGMCNAIDEIFVCIFLIYILDPLVFFFFVRCSLCDVNSCISIIY